MLILYTFHVLNHLSYLFYLSLFLPVVGENNILTYIDNKPCPRKVICPYKVTKKYNEKSVFMCKVQGLLL